MKEESTAFAIVQNIDQKYVPTPVLFQPLGVELPTAITTIWLRLRLQVLAL